MSPNTLMEKPVFAGNWTVKTESRPTEEAAFQRIVDWYESLSESSLDTMGKVYGPACRFRDPFRELHGLDALKRHFATLFAKYRHFGFRFTERVVDGRRAVLFWTFQFQRGPFRRAVRGSFLLKLDRDGRIEHHEDYWDVSEEVYEKMPGVGLFFRGVKKCLSALAC